MVGRTVDVPKNPDKIIGIGSTSLRLICYLQAQDKVVGVEQAEHEDSVTCTYRHVNHDKFANLPVIGEGGSKGVTPNEEAIIAAAPQVIIASIDKDSADALQQKTGIPVVCVTLSDLVFDQVFYDNVTLVGQVLGTEDRANEVIKYMQDTENDLNTRTANVESKTAYAGGISYRGGHGFAGTEAGFAPFVITKTTNIADASQTTGCFDIDLEAVTAAQPEYIFIESGNIGLVKEDVSANPDYFHNLKAVESGNVYSLVSYRFYATNVDLAIANCYQVGCVVYPEQFSDVDPTKKLDEITTFFLGAPLSEDLAKEGCSFQKYDLFNL
jgi:iron complex transport system substrate-binding protein